MKMGKVLALYCDDGMVFLSIVDPDFDLRDWVEQCVEGLYLLGVVQADLREQDSRKVLMRCLLEDEEEEANNDERCGTH